MTVAIEPAPQLVRVEANEVADLDGGPERLTAGGADAWFPTVTVARGTWCEVGSCRDQDAEEGVVECCCSSRRWPDSLRAPWKSRIDRRAVALVYTSHATAKAAPFRERASAALMSASWPMHERSLRSGWRTIHRRRRLARVRCSREVNGHSYNAHLFDKA